LVQVTLSDHWYLGIESSSFSAAASGHMTFNQEARLDVAVVVDLRTDSDRLMERMGRCMATREYSVQECAESVSDGEF